MNIPTDAIINCISGQKEIFLQTLMKINNIKMAKHFALVGLAVAATLITPTVQAQNSLNGSTNFVTTAVPFLRITPDARSGAMGDVGLAISPDANAQYWNVAKLPFSTTNMGFSATYTPWLKELVPDIFLAYLSGYSKFGPDKNQAISGSLRYFSLGNINYTDNFGQPTGTGSPREYSLDLGYSRRLSEYLSTGLSLRYIHSAIAAGVTYTPGNNYKPGNAMSADLGVYYTKTKEKEDGKNTTLSLAGVVSNLGTKISYNSTRKDFIPMNLGIGSAYTMGIDEYNKVTFALDINKLLVPELNNTDSQVSVVSGVFSSFSGGDQIKKLDVSLGGEYWYKEQFAIRAGYFYEDKTNGDRQYITIGGGMKYNIFEINFAYLLPQGSGITRNPLSNTLRFSLMFNLDKFEKETTDSGSEETPPATGDAGAGGAK